MATEAENHRRPHRLIFLEMLALSSVASTGFNNANLWNTGNLIPQRGVDWGAQPWSTSEISDKAGLQDLAKKLNPAVGYWDPLDVGSKKPLRNVQSCFQV